MSQPTVEIRCPKCLNITERDGKSIHVTAELDRRDAQIAALTAKLVTVKNLLNGLGHAGYCAAEIATHAPNWQGKLPACDCGLDEILREVGL